MVQVLEAVPGLLDPSHLLMGLSVSLGKACVWLTHEEAFASASIPASQICFPGPDGT